MVDGVSTATMRIQIVICNPGYNSGKKYNSTKTYSGPTLRSARTCTCTKTHYTIKTYIIDKNMQFSHI